MATLLGVFSGILLLISPATYAHEETSPACNGKYKGEGKPSSEELSKILRDHSEWLSREAEQPGERLANLCEADLRKAQLAKANLRRANLVRAKLREADLNGANLSRSDLRGANLRWAILTNTDLHETKLRDADFREADLAFSVFEPEPGSLPITREITRARNLSQMTFNNSPHALVELREEFKRAGMWEQERAITFAINRAKSLQDWRQGIGGKLKSAFNYMLFDITSNYGMSPGRPLLWLSCLILVFSLPYMIALNSLGKGGIWVVWSADRIGKDEGSDQPLRVSVEFTLRRPNQVTRMVGLALYFSLLSAFRIGWRDFNVGSWIARLQAHEYSFHATGWVRTLSGVQSLISLYLLVLSVLTYFGRPFE